MTEAEAFKLLGQFPHCDGRVLHKPGDCKYCDDRPQWQAYRIAMKINFTGESDPEKMPCPSSRDRSARQAHRWPGNRPTNVIFTNDDLRDPTYGERLRDE